MITDDTIDTKLQIARVKDHVAASKLILGAFNYGENYERLGDEYVYLDTTKMDPSGPPSICGSFNDEALMQYMAVELKKHFDLIAFDYSTIKFAHITDNIMQCMFKMLDIGGSIYIPAHSGICSRGMVREVAMIREKYRSCREMVFDGLVLFKYKRDGDGECILNDDGKKVMEEVMCDMSEFASKNAYMMVQAGFLNADIIENDGDEIMLYPINGGDHFSQTMAYYYASKY